MTLLTAIQIAANYPGNVYINALSAKSGKWACFCYLKKHGATHELLCKSGYVFSTEQEAFDYMHDSAKDFVQRFKINETILS